MADFDLSDFLKEGALSDLSWLDVNEEEYRKLDQLPKQNLDVVPDLEAAWSHDDKPATAFFHKDRPHTMGDLGGSNLRPKPEEIVRTARLAVMQSTDPGHFKHALTTRFDPDSLRSTRTALATVLAERGLLGRFYIEASDFPGCENSSKNAKDFVRRYAGDAKFVKAKTACTGCANAIRQPTGSTTCAVFHKEIVVDVPYTEALAQQIENLQQAKGKAVQASSQDPKERIRLAMLAGDASYGTSPSAKPVVNPAQYMKPTTAPEQVIVKANLTLQRESAKEAIGWALSAGKIDVPTAQQAYRVVAASQDAFELASIEAEAKGLPAPDRAVYAGAGQAAPVAAPVSQAQVEEQLIAASTLTRKRDEAARLAIASRKAAPVIALLRREMLKGRSADELVHAMKLAFQVTDLQETRALWEPVFREAGLYGAVYTTQASFDECREGADFVAKHNPGIRAVVAGEKCGGCIYNKVGRCMLYGKQLVANTTDVVTWETVDAVLQEQKIAGRIASWNAKVASAWGNTPADALKAIHRASALKAGPSVASPFRNDVFTAFNGNAASHVTSGLTKREVVKTASKYLNEGLYGDALLGALKLRFDARDLIAASEDLKPVLGEQGLQGIFYIDASIYDDYGKGCAEAARLYRSKGVPYVKLAEKCLGCVHQTKIGHCSVINKPLVIEPPYADKAAQQRAVLASGNATEISYESLQNNGHTMLAEFQMQGGAPMPDIEVNEAPQKLAYEVEFDPMKKVKL